MVAEAVAESPETDVNPAALITNDPDENELKPDVHVDDCDETREAEAALQRIRTDTLLPAAFKSCDQLSTNSQAAVSKRVDFTRILHRC